MSMTRADFIFSLILTGLGVFVVVESWRMPRLANLGVEPWSVPGVVPGLIGGVLTILGVILLLRSMRRIARNDPGAEPEPIRFSRFLATAALTLTYAAILVGLLPFWLATFLFVAVFIMAFEWGQAKNRLWLALMALVEAAIVAGVVTAIFRYVFLVRLP